MDEMITYVFIDAHGTEVSEEYDSVLEARTIHTSQEWDPKIGPLRLVKKIYVFTGTYEEIRSWARLDPDCHLGRVRAAVAELERQGEVIPALSVPDDFFDEKKPE